MKKQSYLFVAMFVLMVAGLLVAAGTDFTGTWVLDESKQEAADGGPRMVAGKIIITQGDNSFSTERNMSNEMMGDFTISTNTTLDGKESTSEEQFGTRKSTAAWSDDKKTLTVNSILNMNFNGEDMEMKSTEVWTLEDENTVLKLKTTSDTPMGLMESVNYYKKSE